MPPSFFSRTWRRMRTRTGQYNCMQSPRRYRLECEQLEDRNLPSGLSGVWSAGPVAPGGLGTMLLLTDGTVIAQSGEYWNRLSPDVHGSYANGSWSALPQSLMNTQRLYFGSAILPSGGLFLVGGEYSTPAYTQNDSNLSETFDPLTDTWGYNAPFPQGNFCDDPVEVLPNGNVLAGYVFGPQTYIYNPGTNTWSNGPTKVYNDQSDEETWTRLPNGDILTYDIFDSINSGVVKGEIYNPNTNTWSPTTNSTTNPPSQLSSPSIGYELGPAELLPDGRVFQIGANGNTAFYDYRTNLWSAGPQIKNAAGQLFGSDDAPSAIVPGGQVIFAADAGPTYGLFSAPTELFSFDPTTNTISQIPTSSLPTGLQSDLSGEGSYVTRMLMLPSGQLALSDSSSQLWLFTPSTSDAPAPTWRPTITHVAYNSSAGQFTLTGTRLNGLSEGSSYGDDVSNSSNYPIVQLRTLSGTDYFAYTSGWTPSVSAAGDNTSQSAQFILPDGVPAGTYLLTVSANGITSNPLFYNITTAEQTVQPPNLVVTGDSQYTETYDYFDYYYFGYDYQYTPYDFYYSNSAANNYSQYAYGYYFNQYYANAYGDTNAAQQISYYGHTGIATTANAYANPVQTNSSYYAYYAYSFSEATGSLNFTLATESLVTFAYNSGASVVTSGGTSYAYADAFGQVENNSTGGYYYVYDNAYAYNGGGPYSFYGPGSFVIDLPAGNYTLYSESYVYAYSYTNNSALASAYNGVALTQITPVSGSGGDSSTPAVTLGSGSAATPALTLGGGSNPAALSEPLLASAGFLTGGAGPNSTAPPTAPLGMAFQAPGQTAVTPTQQRNLDSVFASVGSSSSPSAFLGSVNLLASDGSGVDSTEFWQPFKGPRPADHV